MVSGVPAGVTAGMRAASESVTLTAPGKQTPVSPLMAFASPCAILQPKESDRGARPLCAISSMGRGGLYWGLQLPESAGTLSHVISDIA